MQIFLHLFGHLAQICSVIWRKFVRSFGAILFGILALYHSELFRIFIPKILKESFFLHFFLHFRAESGKYLVWLFILYSSEIQNRNNYDNQKQTDP